MWELNLSVAVCKVDCLEIVEKDNWFQLHELASDFCELWDLLHRDWSIQLEHVPKSANEVVDCLAGLGANQSCAFIHFRVPSFST